jgi:pimeloyl-ACP methyl ester carboxylesterase
VRAIPGVDLVVDNDGKDRLAELVTAVPSVRRLPLLHRPAPAERLRTRVAIKAQTGCDEWCTFCIIPRTRGPLRSYPEAQIVDDVRRQVDRGVREVVLTGVHLGKYGDDRGETDALARLVDRLTAIDGLLRLRISSVLPVQVTPALVARVRDDPKVCRHLHVPLQAGDDEVLAAVNGDRAEAEGDGGNDVVNAVADGDAVADGYPAENGEVPLPDWSAFEEEELVDLDDEARAAFRERAIPSPEHVTRDPQQLSDERRYDVPVTVICTEFTSQMLRDWAERGLAPVREFARIRDVEYVDLPTGHWPQFTRPKELARTILASVGPA